MRRNRRQSLNEENLNGEIEQKEGFRLDLKDLKVY